MTGMLFDENLTILGLEKLKTKLFYQVTFFYLSRLSPWG